EIVEAGKGFKRLQKGTKGLSSSFKGSPARSFGERVVEPHGLSWFKPQKEVNYASNNWIYEGRLALEFSAIRDK
ncbi:hypothetical protein HAX54_000458, partial [Datura stramonium]|nr:hypothetical protein [Datura stramonium]